MRNINRQLPGCDFAQRLDDYPVGRRSAEDALFPSLEPARPLGYSEHQLEVVGAVGKAVVNGGSGHGRYFTILGGRTPGWGRKGVFVRESAPMQAGPGTVVARTLSQRRITEHLRVLRVALEQPLSFKAGQFTKVGFPGRAGERDLMRSYSFVNPPGADFCEFCYSVLPEGGNLTPLLDQLDPGDELLVSTRPAGFLVLEEIPPAENIFFTATGTGIGPFLSIMDSAEVWQRFKKVVLVHGVARAADMAYRDKVAQLAASHPEQFCLASLITREEHADSLQMRIPQAFAAGRIQEIARVELDVRTCQFMLCGNPDMVKETSAWLAGQGFARNRRSAPGNVTIEKYW